MPEHDISLLRAQIRNSVPASALYEQLAEECCELAQAALKCARYLRDENPVCNEDLSWYRQLREEYNDVLNVAGALDITQMENEEMQLEKTHRWVERLRNKGLLREV